MRTEQLQANTLLGFGWRFVQDLQTVNAAMKQRARGLPNPYTILGQFPVDSQWFSVVDLANAFFSIPLDKVLACIHV